MQGYGMLVLLFKNNEPMTAKTKTILITPFVLAQAFPAMASNQSAPESFVLGDAHFRVDITARPDSLLPIFGPRFDQTAMVNQVWLNGNSYLSPNGLIDEFGIDGTGVLGFDSTPIGCDFLKIGVGVLMRTSNSEYQFNRKYQVQQLIPSKVRREGNTVTIQQSGSLINQYGYAYTKRYRVLPHSATLVIEYELKNTGQQPLAFNQYNHNWFNFSGCDTAPSSFVSTAFPVAGAYDAAWLNVSGDVPKLRLSLEKATSKHYLKSLQSAPTASNRFMTGNTKTGQKIEVSGDFEMSRFDLYVEKSALCPEVFIMDTVKVEQTKKWKRIYRFSTTT